MKVAGAVQGSEPVHGVNSDPDDCSSPPSWLLKTPLCDARSVVVPVVPTVKTPLFAFSGMSLLVTLIAAVAEPCENA